MSNLKLHVKPKWRVIARRGQNLYRLTLRGYRESKDALRAAEICFSEGAGGLRGLTIVSCVRTDLPKSERRNLMPKQLELCRG